MPFTNALGAVNNHPVQAHTNNPFAMSSPLDARTPKANIHMRNTQGNVSMMASGANTVDVIKAQRPSGIEAISKNNFGRRTQTIQMIGGKTSSHNLSRNFIHGHMRSNPIFMNIPQNKTEDLKTESTNVAEFKIDGEQKQEMHEDHFGESLQLSAFQAAVWSGFMNWLAFASPASAKTYPFMEKVNNFDVAALATAEQPTGFIVPKTPLPVYKEFIFDDAKQQFGQYAFRFANGTFTDKTAVKASIFPQLYEGEFSPGGNLFAIAIITGLAIVAYPQVIKKLQVALSKFSAEMPEGQTNDWVMGPKKFPFVKYDDNFLGLKAQREKETKRTLDHIEKVRAFWAAQEPRYEAQRAAKKERLRLQQANGWNLPFYEVVMKERKEKGPAWFFMKNDFYASLAFKQPQFETVPPVKSFVDENEEKPVEAKK